MKTKLKRVLKKIGFEARDMSKFLVMWCFGLASAYLNVNFLFRLLIVLGFSFVLCNSEEILHQVFKDRKEKHALEKLLENAKK
jgi:hypothetical protein